MKVRRSLEDLIGAENIGGRAAPASAPSLSRDRGRDSAIAGGAYEGASRLKREIALWTPPLRSADADILDDKDTANGRARDVLRNDAYIYAAEQLHRDGVVGSLYVLNAKPNVIALGIDDEKWEQEFQEEVESKWTLWAESPDNWVDASRRNTFTGLVRLAVGVYLAAGEVLATAEWIREGGRPYKTAIQMIESERLSNPNYGINQGRMRGGILFDRYGAPLTYHIRDSHPSDIANMEDRWTWTAYPARMRWGRERVLHIMEQQRIAQSRGVSELVYALKEMKTTKHFRDIMLQNAVVNATFAASIESELPTQAYELVGGGDSEPLIDYAEQYLGAVSDYAGGARSLTIDGVRIPHLFPGQKLQLRPAGANGPLGTEFEASLLRYIAADLGVSYEELSGDYSKTNYSSGRMGALRTWKRMTARKIMVADRFATSAYRLWFEEAVNNGDLETMKGRPDFYEGMNKDAYTVCDWLGAARGQIDELKETQAAMMRINNNLSTLEEELGRQGKDWRKTLAQRAREKAMVDELGLTPVQDNRMSNSLTGDPREPRDDEDEGGGSNAER